MKKSMVWLTLAAWAGAGCLDRSSTMDKAMPPPERTVARKEPVKPVTAGDVSAANAREAADKLRMELDRSGGRE